MRDQLAAGYRRPPFALGASAANDGGGYAGISNNTSGIALPEARVIPSIGVVVAEPYNYLRARNIAATTVPIWRAAPPTPSAGGVDGGRSQRVGEMAGSTHGFGFGVVGGLAIPSAPPLSPFFDDMASASVLTRFRQQPGRPSENSQYP